MKVNELFNGVKLVELSTDLLARYKKASSAASSAADAAGDYETGNKRYSGIIKATKKQFQNSELATKRKFKIHDAVVISGFHDDLNGKSGHVVNYQGTNAVVDVYGIGRVTVPQDSLEADDGHHELTR